MSLVTINGVSVISGTISMPQTGIWIADLVIDQPDGSGFGDGTKVTISTDLISLVGVVAPARNGDFLDTVHVRVLGGAGGMAKQVKARAFIQPGAFVRDVLNAVSADTGETLSASIDQGFLGSNLQAWSIMAGNTATWNLKALLQWTQPAFSWRILADGTLWIGAETWQQTSGDYEIIEAQPAQGTFTLGCESPFIFPGSSLSDVGNVNHVEHQIFSNKIRTIVSIDLPEGERGAAAAIERLIQSEMAGVDFFALYDAKVVSQSADGATVDIQPVDSRLAGMQRVPLRLGLPGCTVKFAPGAIVRLGWDRGNPEFPYTCLFNGGESLISVAIGSAADGVITKQDFTALLNQIASATYVLATGPGVTGGTATPLIFSPPGAYGSNSVSVQR